MLIEGKNIAIFLHNRPFFGAYLVQIPFLVMLRKYYPDANLVGVSKNKNAILLVNSGFLDTLEVVEKREQFQLLKKYNFDAGFNLRPSSIAVAFQMLLLKIPYRVGFKKFGAFYTKSVPLDLTVYRANLFLKLLNVEDVSSIAPYFKENFSYNDDFSNGVLLAPGAGGEEKKWPIEKYILLANRFIKNGEDKIFFIIGPQEEKERELLEKKGFKVIVNLDLNSLISLILSCKIFISNDCGPSHVAHILGVNQIVLFNEFLPEWFLKRNNSKYISSIHGLASINVEEVIEVANCIINDN